MGKDIDSIHPRKNNKKPKGVLMAYSINNHQPVQCTMISEQPFFYMDEEMVFEEDAILGDEIAYDFDDDTSGNLEEELLKLKHKIDSYERLSLEFSKSEDEIHQKFLMDSHVIGREPAKIDYQATLDQITKALGQSRYSKLLLDFAISNNISITLSDQVETADYDRKAGKILIRHDLDLTEQVLLSVQELRRHWQHQHGALVHPLAFHPDQAVLINRAQLADLSVAVIRTAWELKIDGHSGYWARIENSPLSDLGRALAREAMTDFRTLNNGKAASAVFETWFLSERCRHQDKKLIQAMLADYRGYVFDTAEASRMVSIDLICALGEQPSTTGGGKNYLAPYAQMIINDPIFTDVRDRSNANFLWFIKFEREFDETEQELQSSGVIRSPDPQLHREQGHNKNINEDTIHETSYTDADKERLRQSIFNNPQASGDDNVIHVQFGSNKHTREGILS